MSTGKLLILSAPSGAGKTTLLKRVMTDLPGLAFSISHTTRQPRVGEQDGVDYHFIDRPRFEAMRDQGAFLEWAEVHGNLYGTSRQAVLEQLATGVDVVLDIDVQGATQIRDAVELPMASLFITPPSLRELERRLRGRGTDREETILLRLQNARQEMAVAAGYDYLVVNGDLEQAVETLKAIVIAERSRGHRLPDGKPIRALGEV